MPKRGRPLAAARALETRETARLATETAATTTKATAASEAVAAARAATAARPATAAALGARSASQDLRLHRNEAFALHLFAGELSGTAHRLCLLASLLFRG